MSGRPKKLIIEWVNPSGSSNNQLVTANLKTDILRGGTPTILVPPGKVWVIVDQVNGNATIGGKIELLIDDEPVALSDDATRYDPANSDRTRDLVGIRIYGGHTIKANVYVNANTGADPVTESMILYIEEYDMF